MDILILDALRDRESGYDMNKELVGKRSQNTDADRRRQPTRVEAEAAVRTLIEWAGDDPDREGLLGTPNASCVHMKSSSLDTTKTPLLCSRRHSRKQPTTMK